MTATSRFLAAACLAGLVAAVGELGAAEGKTDPVKLLSKANNAFACELYRQLPREGNLVVSPYGVAAVLSMVHAGAGGETFAEMARVLHFNDVNLQPHTAHANALAHFQATDRGGGCRLDIANGLWLQEGRQVLEPFAATIRDSYAAGYRELDLRENPSGSALAINDWVAKQTRGRIVNLIAPGDFNAESLFVLTNAIYFAGKWARAFEPRLTETLPFTVRPGERREVPTMHEVNTFTYMGNETVQFLQLPYRGGDLAMFVVLPRAVGGLPAIEAAVTLAWLNELLHQMTRQQLSVYLPRWKMETTLELNDALKALGMTTAFSFQQADFSAVARDGPIALTLVRQKATVKVDEKGTVVVAVASPRARSGGFGGEPIATAVFNADHPFLFLICHLRTGHILFMGRVADPSRG